LLAFAVVVLTAHFLAQEATDNQQGVNAEADAPLLHAVGVWGFEPSTKDLQRILDQGANINARDEQGRTPLMIAACSPWSPDLTRFLLEKGTAVRSEYSSLP